MNRMLILVVLAGLSLTMGCVQPRQMTPSEFYGECIFPGGRDTCDSDQSICGDFQAVLTAGHAGVAECIQACNTLQLQEYNQYVIQSCNGTIDAATDLCEQYCHRKYGK